MSSSRHLLLAVLLLTGVASLGMFTIVWPCYRDAAECARKTEETRTKRQNPQAQAAAIEGLCKELAMLKRRIESELKLVPEQPEAVGPVFVGPPLIDGDGADAQTGELIDPRVIVEAQAAEIDRLAADLEVLNDRLAKGLKPVPASADLAGLMGVLSAVIEGDEVHEHTLMAGDSREASPGSDSKAMAQPLTVEMTARFGAIFKLMQAVESLPRLLRIASVTIDCEGGLNAADGDADRAPAPLPAEDQAAPLRRGPTVVTTGDAASQRAPEVKKAGAKAVVVVEAIYEPRPEVH